MEIRITQLDDPSKTLVEWAEVISNLRREYPDNAVLTFDIGDMDDSITAMLITDKSVGNDVSIPATSSVVLKVSDVTVQSPPDLP